MKERSLILFTILSQLAIGTFWTFGLLQAWLANGLMAQSEASRWVWLVVSLTMGLGLLASFFHLGKPANAWRAVHNIRRSWLSREILCATLFMAASCLFAGLQWFAGGVSGLQLLIGGVTGLLGLALVIAMGQAYHLRTVPAWNTWATTTSFLATTFVLGALSTRVIAQNSAVLPPEWQPVVRTALMGWGVFWLGLELACVPLWLAGLNGSDAAQTSYWKVTQKHGVALKIRLVLIIAAILAAGAYLGLSGGQFRVVQPAAGLLSFGLVLAAEIVGRLIFYEARVRHGV